ncbi:MAG: hypothetical protein KFW21_00315 [Spirochaetota bacterium]|nr:hypothetical protein [Spirochaetota bacterium]
MKFIINSPLYSFVSFIIGIFLLIYLWLPLFVILIVGFFFYIIVVLIIACIRGKSPNFNIKVVNIKAYQDPFEQTKSQNDPIDYIDSTTLEKEKK